MHNAAAAVLMLMGTAWFLTSARAQVQPVPGPGTGIVRVQGAVTVSDPIRASQHGEWKVAISNQPEVRINATAPVRVVAPAFVVAGLRYDVAWSDGSTETVRIVDLVSGSWAKVDDDGRDRWINLGIARSIRRVR